MFATDFEYADKRLSDFGCIICEIEKGSSISETDMGCDITFNTIKNNHSSIHYPTSSTYESTCTTTFEIMKNPCIYYENEIYMTYEEVRNLTKWLNRREYRKFKLFHTDDISDTHYYGSFNVKKKEINGKTASLVLTFNSNSPFGYGDPIRNEFDFDYIQSKTGGENITITPEKETPFLNILLYGKTFQNTDDITSPSIEYPQDIHCLGESGSIEIHVHGESPTKTDISSEGPQLFTLLTPNGLKGLPVSDVSLADYTDTNGQAWISDYIDLRRGKHVQRIFEVVIDGSKVFGSPDDTVWNIILEDSFGHKGISALNTTNAISDRFVIQHIDSNCIDENSNSLYFSNTGEHISFNLGLFETADEDGFLKFFSQYPTKIQYVLVEPIETDLTEEELKQYKTLLPNYPTTTIVNNDGVYMEVEYVSVFKNTFSICGDSDEVGIIYPNITITKGDSYDNRKCKITNITSKTTTSIDNMSVGETIILNGEHKTIETESAAHTTLYNDFNYEWLDIIIDNGFCENEYQVNTPCHISIEYKPIRKVGVC